jgi:hypothetical protein
MRKDFEMDDYQRFATLAKDSEIDQLKRALAGDAKAKIAIDAKELLSKADRVTAGLRDRAEKGDQAALQTLRSIAAGATTTPAVPKLRGSASAPVNAQASQEKAVRAARAAERARIKQVFASDASKGRERLAAELLAAPEGWAASDIITKLPAVDASLAAKRGAAGGSVWERAYAKVEAHREAGASKVGKPAAANDPWARAYAGTAEQGVAS